MFDKENKAPTTSTTNESSSKVNRRQRLPRHSRILHSWIIGQDDVYPGRERISRRNRTLRCDLGDLSPHC